MCLPDHGLGSGYEFSRGLWFSKLILTLIFVSATAKNTYIFRRNMKNILVWFFLVWYYFSLTLGILDYQRRREFLNYKLLQCRLRYSWPLATTRNPELEVIAI